MTDSYTEPTAPRGRNHMTPREKRRRMILLSILLVLLALLAYATYYFLENRRLPVLEVAAPEELIEPPRFLYAITGEGENDLTRPVGVGVAPDGRVYAVDFDQRRISVFTNRGSYLFSFDKVDDGKVLRNPVHLVIKDDEVWVTDRRLRGIFVFELDGTFKRRFTPKNEEDIAWTPLALAFSSKGELRVTDVGKTDRHRLHYFSEEGSRTATLGRTVQVNAPDEQPGGFLFPNGLAVARDGRVFVSDGDNRRVQVFDDKGEFKAFVDTSGIPRGIAIDAEQRLYVVDAIAHTVDIYDLNGKRLTQFGGQGFGPGQFNYPNDIAIGPNGRIFVSDRDNNQVQVWGWPVAEPPAVTLPSSPWGWLACLSPLLLLPFLLLLRKVRIVVTPDFVDGLVAAGEIAAVAKRRRLRLVIPEEDVDRYEGRVVDGIALMDVLHTEAYSESDARAIAARLECTERESIVLAMASRAKALGTNDRDLRRLAVLLEQRAVSVDEFRERFLAGKS